jgi:hypothetical protein
MIRPRTAAIGGIIALLMNVLCFVVTERSNYKTGMQRGDFKMFYAAATALRTGKGSLVYDRALETKLQRDIFPELSESGVQVYTHPPFELLVYLPFSFLPYRTACFLWQLASVGLAVVSASMLARCPGKQSRVSAYILVLGSFPFFILLMFQQDSALLLLFATLALRAFQENKDSLAGAFLAMALFRFPIVLPLLGLLCMRRPRLLKGAIPVVLLLGIISISLVKPAGVLAYGEYLLRMTRDSSMRVSDIYQIDPRMMPTLRGLFFLSHVPFVAPIACVITILVCARIMRRSPDSAFQFAVAVIGALLLSPHSLMHDLTLIAIPAAFLGEAAAPMLTFYLAPFMVLFYPQAQAWLAIPLLAALGLSLSRRSLTKHQIGGEPQPLELCRS